MKTAPSGLANDPLEAVYERLDPKSNRKLALKDLDASFRAGSPPTGLDGFRSGRLVTTSIAPPLDGVTRRLAALWMPWLGKSFDAERSTGINILRPSARAPVKMLWSSYELPAEGAPTLDVFPFKTSIGPGAVDPDVMVLKIDYDFEPNPNFMIRHILDELVQIEEGYYLGKILYRTRKGHRPIGFFSLHA
jgi:hypothetical protein